MAGRKKNTVGKKLCSSGESTIFVPRDVLDKDSTILPPTISRRYKILRALGRGAFGVVYLAEDKKIGRLVAIKQLFEDHEQNVELRKRFRQEAKIAGRLEHPNIVTLYNLEGSRKSSCIIMEYLGGGSLEELLDRSGKLDPLLAIQIMLGIMTGLDVAHQMGVIHRDIKPQNILFGIGTNPKITDFGVAHLPVSAGGFASLDSSSEKRSIIGTPLYMSPEQISTEEVDTRTDIYSAGVIFYRMLTGNPLFEVQGKVELDYIRERILKVEPESVCDMSGGTLPKELDQVISKLLHKDRDKRYPDAISVIRDLVKVLSKIKKPELDETLLLMPASQAINSPGAILEDIIYLLLVDGVITREERIELDKRTEMLGISRVQARAVEDKVRKKMNLPDAAAIQEFTETLEEFLFINKRKNFTEEQETALSELQQKLGIDSIIRSKLIHQVKSSLGSP